MRRPDVKIELAEDALAEAWSRPESPGSISNADGGEIAEVLEDDLRAGMRTDHAAWEHFGAVWYDAATGQFVEAVKRYRVLVAVHSAESLRDLVHEVNDAWGWE
jgi:hypothetical protein